MWMWISMSALFLFCLGNLWLLFKTWDQRDRDVSFTQDRIDDARRKINSCMDAVCRLERNENGVNNTLHLLRPVIALQYEKKNLEAYMKTAASAALSKKTTDVLVKNSKANIAKLKKELF